MLRAGPLGPRQASLKPEEAQRVAAGPTHLTQRPRVRARPALHQWLLRQQTVLTVAPALTTSTKT